MNKTFDQRGIPLTLKIEAFSRLTRQDQAIIDRLAGKSVRVVGARRDVIREGDAPRSVNFILEGWACRYKQLPDGRRQIVSFFLPGDLCDANVFILKEMDHSIGAITQVKVAEISPPDFEAMMADSPRILQALWWNELVNGAVQREWTLNVGQRTAYERIGHLLCELFIRLEAMAMTNGASCDFPLTQVDLADATGITPVHVNRTLQELRKDGLVELHGRVLTLPDLERLKQLSFFNPNYLHLNRHDHLTDRD